MCVPIFIKRTKEGMLLRCLCSDTYQLLFKNINYNLTLFELNSFADYIKTIDENYWKKNALIWKNVRTKWQTVFDLNKDLNLETVVDGKPLFEHLFSLKPTATKVESDKIIDSFVKK